ncbi:unnamed protein product [Moneuplotes crassus]|uniref:Uncharacterized protein n=1 Tax=Euplotes crassus TaxID=5936 RepID=A0AAD1XHL4_EUPCR|nr:unnamed protein product [Moneuplotes crassus]
MNARTFCFADKENKLKRRNLGYYDVPDFSSFLPSDERINYKCKDLRSQLRQVKHKFDEPEEDVEPKTNMRFKCYAKGNLNSLLAQKSNPLLAKKVNELKYRLKNGTTFSGIEASNGNIPIAKTANQMKQRRNSVIAHDELLVTSTPSRSTFTQGLLRSLSCPSLEQRTPFLYNQKPDIKLLKRQTTQNNKTHKLKVLACCSYLSKKESNFSLKQSLSRNLNTKPILMEQKDFYATFDAMLPDKSKISLHHKKNAIINMIDKHRQNDQQVKR